MESENLEIPQISTTNNTSSWPIIRGSLDDAITCESSISAVDSDSESDHAVQLMRRAPLIMRRPSPESDPCEITIHFTQQHEIKQIYVRSTARVYEIYYAADEKGDNQYLCTVRCGLAARMEDVLQETDGVESYSASSSSSNRSSCESSSATEDGWVDVKVQNPCIRDAGDVCLEKKDGGCMERGNQDCFEATAEISDADPVQSVTLRLLSIQSGDHVYIDEVYVFADPVVSTDTNSSTNAKETSSESATMSLLIPTLLNLSKLRRNQMQEQSDSVVGERKHQDSEHKSIGREIESNTSQSKSTQGTMLNGTSVPLSQPDLPVQRPDSQNKPYITSERTEFSCSRIEKTLDELVSRVAKIEHFCMRFEENMLKPIVNMEARLERVEQQLESFAENAKSSIAACTKLSDPEFSRTESESNNIFTGRNDSPVDSAFKSIKKDECHPQDMSVPSLNEKSSVSIPPNDLSPCTINQLTPSLVVTAPDFSCDDDDDDDEGEIDSFEAVKDSPRSSVKKPVSIDDALASALSGLLSSASIDTVVVEETANISTKDESGSTCPSELIQSDECVVPSDHIHGSNISGKDIVVTEQETHAADDDYKDATPPIDEHIFLFTEGDYEKPLGNSDCNVASSDQVERSIGDLSMDVSSREANDDSNQTFGLGSSDSSVNNFSVAAEDTASSGEDIVNECPSLLLNTFKLQSPAILDFGIPILDVKFSSQESFSTKSSLDTLLMGVPDTHNEALRVEEDNTTSLSEQSDLVMIENVDSISSETPNNQLFCLDNYDSSCMPSNREEELPEPYRRSTEEMDASLI